jgi:two-component system, NarL family, invasion response regulator UvrY
MTTATHPRILVADDHRLVRHTLAEVLAEQFDADVEQAADGLEALDLLRDHDVEVAVLDISMPGKSGLDVLEKIKAEKSHLKIIVISAYGAEYYAERARRLGAECFIEKSDVPEKLVPTIQRILDEDAADVSL